MNLHFEIFSKAMYSTWCFHKDSGTLLDCGEGVANYFENRVFAIKNILFSHFHGDHLLGLPSLLLSRNSAMGDKDKKINVFYPANNIRFETFFNFLKFYYSREAKLLNFIGISENQEILEVSNNHYFTTFKTNHLPDSLGFSLVEKRNRLKECFIGQNIPEVIKKYGKENISEEYHFKLFSYAVDAANVNPEDIKNSKLLFVDSTFLNIEDRNEEKLSHFTIKEAYDLAKESKCKNVVFMHLSKRYDWEQFNLYLKEKTDYKNDFKSVTVLNPNIVNHLKY